MLLINCKISVQLKWSRKFIIVATTTNNQNPTFRINHTKLYVPVVTLSTQENMKLLKQIQSSFKRTINWNKYRAKTANQVQNRYLEFVLSFKNDDDRESHKQHYLPTVEIKDYNVMINGRNFFDQPVKNDLKT